jgi:hypothetical protein
VPSVSQKQHNLMAMVANNPAAAKRVGIPQSVGQDFAAADKGIKIKGGVRSRADLQKINKPETRQGKSELFNKGGSMKESKAMVGKEMAFMKKKGAPASMMKHEKAEMMGMKKGGMKKMAAGGSASSRADGIAQKGKTKGKMMAKGGKAC